MLIGELAERAGTSTRTLRYYEQHGLVEQLQVDLVVANQTLPARAGPA